ncbi:MAG: GtrA family protein [Clostridiales bacterium]|nr:GtrA family protein [Clostridiales bacterium]
MGIVKKFLSIPFIKKCVNKETINYLIFGVLTTIVNYAVYIAAMWLSGFSEGQDGFMYAVSVSTVIAWIIAVAFAYITNKLYVFESRSFEFKTVFKEVAAFVGARLFSLGCEVLWMMAVVNPKVGMNDKIAKILANVFVVIMNYFFSKFFIFKNKNEEV